MSTFQRAILVILVVAALVTEIELVLVIHGLSQIYERLGH